MPPEWSMEMARRASEAEAEIAVEVEEARAEV